MAGGWSGDVGLPHAETAVSRSASTDRQRQGVEGEARAVDGREGGL